MEGSDPRSVILQIIDELLKEAPTSHLQSGGVLQRAQRKLNIKTLEDERTLLSSFQDLFRIGYLSWGSNLANHSPPFFHVADIGRKALAQHGRDPANPAGYLVHLKTIAGIGPVTESYIREALQTFNSACFKATAVMVGAATESVVFGIRDCLVVHLNQRQVSVPKAFNDWRIKRILDAVEEFVAAKRHTMPQSLFARFEANWPAFTHQIRTARNDAGHPNSIDPVTPEEVHASLLIFPQLALLATELNAWVETATL